MRPAVELLAGIPSVIYGLLGILILNPLMYKLELIIFKGTDHQFTGGANLISAVLVLALMILPTVINISESALRAVPLHFRSASLAMGATRIQTISMWCFRRPSQVLSQLLYWERAEPLEKLWPSVWYPEAR